MATEEGQSPGRILDWRVTQVLPTPTLETERFVMRKLVRDDTAALFPTLSDPENVKYMLSPAFETEEALADWLCDPDWNGRSWSAIDKTTGELAARVVAVPAENDAVEIGYITVCHRYGEGIAFECTQRLLVHLFEVEEIHRVIAITDPRNVPSNRLVEKLGFRREAHFIQNIKTHIGWCDEYLWAMLASEWQVNNGD